jgi:hypothetical protein
MPRRTRCVGTAREGFVLEVGDRGSSFQPRGKKVKNAQVQSLLVPVFIDLKITPGRLRRRAD